MTFPGIFDKKSGKNSVARMRKAQAPFTDHSAGSDLFSECIELKETGVISVKIQNMIALILGEENGYYSECRCHDTAEPQR